MANFAFVNPLTKYFERERSRWSFWLPVAVGVGVASYFALPFEPPLSILGLTPLLAFAAWTLRDRFWGGALFFFVLTLGSLGLSAAKIEAMLDARPMLDQAVNFQKISGRVASTDIMPDGVRLTLIHPHIETVPPEATPEKIRVKFTELDFENAPPTGAEIEFRGSLGAFSEPVAPGAADFRRQAFYQHLGAMGWSRSAPEITNLSPTDYTWGERFDLALECARKTLARHVYERLHGDIAAVTAARLNGEQTGISSPVMEAMRTAGLAHLLATSGANVTVMALLIYFPVRALLSMLPWMALRFPIKKWAAFVAIFSALAFTFLVGSQAATMRSMIMVGLAMLAVIVDRHTTPLRLAMLSALLAMVFAPSATMGASFQLSFAAVFCLVSTTQSFDWEKKGKAFLPEGLQKPVGFIWAIIRASLIATAATTPISIYFFQTFNVYGFLSNTLAIPLTSFWVMPFTILAYLAAPMNWDGFFIDMAGLGNAATIRIATTVASWPGALFHWPAMPDFVLLMILFGGFWLCLWREKWRFWGTLPIILGMLYPFYMDTPDFLVSPSGKTWAVRLEDGRLAVSSLRHEKFAVAQWKDRLGNIDLTEARFLTGGGPIRCDAQGCVYRRGSLLIAMPIKESAALDDCDKASIIIAPFVIRQCAAQTVIDQLFLETHGSVVLNFKGNGETPRFLYARQNKAQRPWSIGFSKRGEFADTDPNNGMK